MLKKKKSVYTISNIYIVLGYKRGMEKCGILQKSFSK